MKKVKRYVLKDTEFFTRAAGASRSRPRMRPGLAQATRRKYKTADYAAGVRRVKLLAWVGKYSFIFTPLIMLALWGLLIGAGVLATRLWP
jgi:hypothetical protein